jgi:hypothetical protein
MYEKMICWKKYYSIPFDSDFLVDQHHSRACEVQDSPILTKNTPFFDVSATSNSSSPEMAWQRLAGRYFGVALQ